MFEQRLGLADRGVGRQPGGQEAVEIVVLGHVDRRSFRIGDARIGVERGPHRLRRPVEARADGPGRDAQRVGGFVEGQAEVVVQDEDRPLVGIEAAEATLELVAVGDVEGRVGVGATSWPSTSTSMVQRCRPRRISR